MTARYTHKNITDIADSASKFGFGDLQESRFPRDDLDAEETGFSHHRFKPGKRQGFGHRHEQAEEVYFVVAGFGRFKLDDEILELKERDVVRVAPGITRAFEAGPDGLEVLAFGPHHADDRGEVIPGWWSE
jgi:mannose-6-phosphate isomerase-like protein (cupin superfamily)